MWRTGDVQAAAGLLSSVQLTANPVLSSASETVKLKLAHGWFVGFAGKDVMHGRQWRPRRGECGRGGGLCFQGSRRTATAVVYREGGSA